MSKKNAKLSERNSTVWKIYKTVMFDLHYAKNDMLFTFCISFPFLVSGLIAFLLNEYLVSLFALCVYSFFVGVMFALWMNMKRFKSMIKHSNG